MLNHYGFSARIEPNFQTFFMITFYEKAYS